MIPTLTQLGKLYKVKDPYGKGYQKLLEATWKAITKDVYNSSWFDFKQVSILPKYAKRLKEAEAYWSEIDFSMDAFKAGLGKKPSDRRAEDSLIPLTMAQLQHMIATDQEVFPNFDKWWGIDCIAECYDGDEEKVPWLYWNAYNRQVKRNWLKAGDSYGDYAVRGGVRKSLVLDPQASSLPLSFDPILSVSSDQSTIIYNGIKYFIEEQEAK